MEFRLISYVYIYNHSPHGWIDDGAHGWVICDWSGHYIGMMGCRRHSILRVCAQPVVYDILLWITTAISSVISVISISMISVVKHAAAVAAYAVASAPTCNFLLL